MTETPHRPWRPNVRPGGRERGPLRVTVRMLDVVRRSSDRILGADPLWSFLFVSVSMILLGTGSCGGGFERFAVGDLAPREIVATADLEVPDPALTQNKRAEAKAAVPDVYLHDRERGERLVSEFAQELKTRAPLPADRIEAVVGVLRGAMQGLVVANKSLLERRPVVLLVRLPGEVEDRLEDFSSVTDLDDARRRVREGVAALPGMGSSDARALGDLAASFVDANLTFDPEATAARRNAAASAVLPIQSSVRKGTVLVREGETITAEILTRLEAQRRPGSPRQRQASFAGLGVVVLLLAFFLWRYTRYHQRYFKKVRHLHALLVSVCLMMLLVAQGVLWLAMELADDFSSPFDDISLYTYLVPLGGGAILVALLANGRIAMIFSCFVALLYGGLTGWDAHRMLWALLVQWAGVYAITTYRERAALLRAGLIVGLAGTVAALAVEGIARSLDPWSHSLYGAALAFLGGAVGAGLLVSFALPMLESVFHVLTDIRLLELSNVNNPLLSQLAIKAPGTYNHSMTVGTLAEEAAKAIEANSLFCRVAAFYHDVGKMRKPEYYVENQRGMNPHDRLNPSMSALIVAAHVKDGVRLAREARLPEQIVAIIPQHHGTRRLTYFLEKARRLNDPALGEISEDDFRYPGPKPQTREAAIFMLADGIEAAARTLDDPTPNRLREVIKKVSAAVILDGQLDECDLTFADLERIEQAFLRTLTSMYHHRVDYPGFDFGRPRGEPRETRGEVRPFRAS